MQRGQNTDLDEPTKDKSRRDKRKRNLAAKALYDQGDHKGAFSIKVVSPRKEKYKRQKLRVNDVNDYEEHD